MTVAALKRSTLYAIVPWGLQRRQSRERRGGSAVLGTGSSSSEEDARFFWAPWHSRAASLNLPGSFYWLQYFFFNYYFFIAYFLPFTSHSSRPWAAELLLRVQVSPAQTPSPVRRPTLNPPPSSPSTCLRHTAIPRGMGREGRSGETGPFIHLTCLLPILFPSIPQQLKIHFHQAVTDTRPKHLTAQCRGIMHSQPLPYPP